MADSRGRRTDQRPDRLRHKPPRFVKDVPDLTDPRVLMDPDPTRLEAQLAAFRKHVCMAGDIHNWYGRVAVAWVGLTTDRDTEVNPYGPAGEYQPAALVVGWARPPHDATGLPDVRSVLVAVDPNTGDPGCRVVGWRSLSGGLGRPGHGPDRGRHLFDREAEVGWLVASLDLAYRLADYGVGRQAYRGFPLAPNLVVHVAGPADPNTGAELPGATYQPDDDIPIDLAAPDRPVRLALDGSRMGYNPYTDHRTGLAVIQRTLPGWGVVHQSVLSMDFQLSAYVRIAYAL